MIECATGGAAFARDCAVEHGRQDGAPALVVRRPDGSFRRFVVTDGGRGLAAADGAERASTAVYAGELEVTVGADHYRFPATVLSDASGR